jgi:hypothetical protein
VRGRWWLLLVLIAIFGCRRREQVAVRADPVVAADASPDVRDEPDTSEGVLGTLVVPGAISFLAGADDTSFRWAVSQGPNTKYPQYDYFERDHEGGGDVRPFSDILGGESPIYIDARWMLTWVYGFNVSDFMNVHDRVSSATHPVPTACPFRDAIARDGRVYLIGGCARGSAVSIFDPKTGALRGWFVTARVIRGVAIDADNLYYLLDDDTLHARSRSTASDTVLLRGSLDPDFAVLDRAAFSCAGNGLHKAPLDGSPNSDLASSCRALVADAHGIVFATEHALFALDAGASVARKIGRIHRPSNERSLAISREWIYFVTADGIRRAPRR